MAKYISNTGLPNIPNELILQILRATEPDRDSVQSFARTSKANASVVYGLSLQVKVKTVVDFDVTDDNEHGPLENLMKRCGEWRHHDLRFRWVSSQW